MDMGKLRGKHSEIFYQLFTILLDQSEKEKGVCTSHTEDISTDQITYWQQNTNVAMLPSSARPVVDFSGKPVTEK